MPRAVVWGVGVGLALVLALPATIVVALLLSLPALDGTVRSRHVSAPLALRRDVNGVVAIDAASFDDAAWALGYAHAQDRFFQMDWLRRYAAGEVSELVGSDGLDEDLARRQWQLRALARQELATARPDLLARVRSYTAGVNAGLASLRLRPIEYLMLRTQPRPWREEDCILIVHAMFLMLTDSDARRKQFLIELRAALPPDVFRFMTWSQGEWDASFIGAPQAPTPPGMPAAPGGARAARRVRHTPSLQSPLNVAGSSAWAVDGSRTRYGGGLLAVDMHLTLSVPNIWYRAQFRVAGPAPRSVYGLTLPGFPGFVVGTNEHIAWGLSNTQGDWSELLVLSACERAGAPGYKVGLACEPFRNVEETIGVAHAPAVVTHVLLTRWGPVIDPDRQGQLLVRRWLGDVPAATNLRFLDLTDATSAAQAIEIARASGMPPVNFVVADSAGGIGWTVAGQLPSRTAPCESAAQRADSPGADQWSRFSDPGSSVRVINPPQGYLVTANQQILPQGGDRPIMCDGAYQLGARALQIARSVRATTVLDESTAMRIQLDDRAIFLQRWRDLLIRVIGEPHDQRYDLLLARLREWDGRASAASVAYRFIREFRDASSEAILGLLAQGSGFAGYELYDNLPQAEYPVWRMLSEQPHAWLPEGVADWNAYIRTIVDQLLESDERVDPQLRRLTWGRRNVLSMRNPVMSRLPLLGKYFGMPAVELPGDSQMPRVQAPSFGASQRLVVMPGHERNGILTMPGGQSANPLSAFFAAGHDRWVEGVPMPLVAGDPRHELRVLPAPP